MTHIDWLYRPGSTTSGQLQVGPLTRLEAEGLGARVRRALLRETPGSAVSAVRIEGAGHEFAVLDGVVEDALQIVERLRCVHIAWSGEGRLEIPVTAHGPVTVTAGDLTIRPEVRVSDPERVIATVNEGGSLEMTIEVTKGTGFRSGSAPAAARAGWIDIDCAYGSVAEVALEVEGPEEASTLTLQVRTNGATGPEEALGEVTWRLDAEAGKALATALARAAERPPLGAENKTSAEPAEARAPRDLSRVRVALPVPDLLDLPRSSYASFLQQGVGPTAREVRGLEKLLRDALPLTLAGGERWHGGGYTVREPGLDAEACRRLGRTWAGALIIHLRQLATGQTTCVEAGAIPLMTEGGTFVIKGREKVVVTQLEGPMANGRNDLTQRLARPVGQQLEEALAAPLAADVEAARQCASTADLGFPRLAAAVAGFFAGGGTVRPVEGTNPLAVLSQARRVVQQGVGRFDFEARDAHLSHYGRLCPLETPEGERIGINLSAALYARVSGDGHMLTPYVKADTGQVEYLAPGAETEAAIADMEADEERRHQYGGQVLGRRQGEICRLDDDEVRYTPVHPAQTLGAASSLIPFLAHDDANRALMAANMQKQAVPLVEAEAPLVRTGLEARIAHSSGAHVRAAAAGTVTRVTAEAITVREGESGVERTYRLRGYSGTAAGTCWRQRPVVGAGQSVADGQVMAAGPCWDDGSLALGRNLLVGYLSWEGATFEDALVVSDRLVQEGRFTSVDVRQFTAIIPATSNRDESLSSGHLDERGRRHLSPRGLVLEGTHVEGGDVLIARASGEGAAAADTSVRMPAGLGGTVTRVEHDTAAGGAPLETGVAEMARVTVVTRRRLGVGDKLANRHGGKGVVGRIVPHDEMPLLPDGRALDLLISPLAVPSRMNLGQLLETHLGLAAQALDCTVVTPAFGGARPEDVRSLLAEARLPESGMLRLRDGRTGHYFEQETTVGYQYYMKLAHMARDKVRARDGGGPQETPGAVGQRGMRVGIMETWALQAYGAEHILQEMQTCKAGDAQIRRQTYAALVSGADLPVAPVPESVKRLVRQLRGLCLDLRFRRADGERLDLLTEGATTDEATTLSLRFADADAVRAWSAGPIEAGMTAAAVANLVRRSEEMRHLELAVAVPHPWQELAGVAVEAVSALPVLPGSLRTARGLDDRYVAVYLADETARKSGLAPAAVEALSQAVAAVLGEGGLARQLRGKRGWFAAAMAGRAVDYSGRAVAAPGIDLEYDQCGLPRRIARVLFEPVVVGDLVRGAQAGTEAEARHLLRSDDPRAAAALEHAAAQRLVLLHRAPVLHRLGIQAFRPVLIDDDVIRLHPLALGPFNADFDGDELDVFLPLSKRAQAEARTMLPSANQLSPAWPEYVRGPQQDMVLGWYYATVVAEGRDLTEEKAARRFASLDAVTAAWATGQVHTRACIAVAAGNGEARQTTVGRALLNAVLPASLRWVEGPLDKRRWRELLSECWLALGPAAAARLADAMVRRGHELATRSGLSIAMATLPQYSGRRELLAEAWRRADGIVADAGVDAPARVEAPDAVVDHWVAVQNAFSRGALEELAADRGGLNPVHLMNASGARGNHRQILQHIAMRGLLAAPDRRLIPVPCTSSFGTGLSPLEHLAGTFGARKGLADTCLKTSRAGFLFKRLMSAVQDVRITEEDCGASEGIAKGAIADSPGGRRPAGERIWGRTAAEDVVVPGAETPVVRRGEVIGAGPAREIAAAGVEPVWVRSPLTCRATDGICSLCYGADLTTRELAAPGLAAGVLAAQSLGEPLTQLTLRVFYVGGLGGHRGHPSANILTGLPRLDELLEAGHSPVQAESEERQVLEAMLERDGVMATAEHLLRQIDGVYRLQGVAIDERHLEVVLARMLAAGPSGQPQVRGVTEAARQIRDVVAVATAHGALPALARLAAAAEEVALDGIRACTTFGRVIPPAAGPSPAGSHGLSA